MAEPEKAPSEVNGPEISSRKDSSSSLPFLDQGSFMPSFSMFDQSPGVIVGNGGDVDDLDAMLARISQLEQSIGDGGGVGGSAVSRSLPVGGDSGGELDQLFEGIGPEEATATEEATPEEATATAEKSNGDAGEGAEGEEGDPPPAKPKMTLPSFDPGWLCSFLWGGPCQATDQDNLWSWLARFFGGVSSAHGINRVFDDESGILRIVFWFGLFCAGFYAAVLFSGDIIGDFLSKGAITSVGSDDHDGELPQVTVCLSSALRCSCEAFYLESVLKNHFRKIVPYLCKEYLVFKDKETDKLDMLNMAPDLAGVDRISGSRTSYTTYENAFAMVHEEKTIKKIADLRASGELAKQTSMCGDATYTASWFNGKVAASDLSYMDLIMYAGYTRRTSMLKECMVIDSEEGSATIGQQVSCMGDEWWSPMWVDEKYGACHTFNPCNGLPMGEPCEDDSECEHELNFMAGSPGKTSNLPKHAKIEGGHCDKEETVPVCKCKSCMAGKDCKHAVQTRKGKGNGMRLILNAAVNEEPLVNSASSAQWAPGVIVHLHSEFDRGMTSKAMSVSPGQVVDVALQRNEYKEMIYPFTNCSSTFNIDESLCRTNCLRRVQADKCCDIKIDPIIKGKFAERVNYTDPKKQLVEIENPLLACNILKDGYRTCMAAEQKKYEDGEICLDGALSFSEGFSWMIFTNSKLNSYSDDVGVSDDGISAMEDRSLEIKKHCVWSEDDNAGMEAFKGGRLGKECDEKADCKTSLGSDGVHGTCSEAHRAYCPPRCKSVAFEPSSVASAKLSAGTVALIADRELAFRTTQQSKKKDSPSSKWWKPLCKAAPAYDSTAYDALDPATWPNEAITYPPTTKDDYTTCAAADVAASTAVADGLCYSQLCMTKDEGKTRVTENYVILNLHHVEFESVTYEKEEAIPLEQLLGILGGNLGLFMGFSVMTVIEWIEGLVFFLLAVPWLFLRMNLLPIFLRKEEVQDELIYDEDVQHVMNNMKEIAAKRKAE